MRWQTGYQQQETYYQSLGRIFARSREIHTTAAGLEQYLDDEIYSESKRFYLADIFSEPVLGPGKNNNKHRQKRCLKPVGQNDKFRSYAGPSLLSLDYKLTLYLPRKRPITAGDLTIRRPDVLIQSSESQWFRQPGKDPAISGSRSICRHAAG